MNGQRIGYRRVSSMDQRTARQLEGVPLDRTFEDKASRKATDRSGLQAALAYCRDGGTFVVHSMDRLVRYFVDLWTMVSDLTAREITEEFIKEQSKFTG